MLVVQQWCLQVSRIRLPVAPSYDPDTKSVVHVQASNVVPINAAATNAELSNENGTASVTFSLESNQPGSEPLELILQDRHQTLHYDARPVNPHHGAHHKHNKIPTSINSDAVAGAGTCPHPDAGYAQSG